MMSFSERPFSLVGLQDNGFSSNVIASSAPMLYTPPVFGTCFAARLVVAVNPEFAHVLGNAPYSTRYSYYIHDTYIISTLHMSTLPENSTSQSSQSSEPALWPLSYC